MQDKEIQDKASKWLKAPFDQETRKQVQYLMEHDDAELKESFYKELEFGTGGLRGLMGVGTNRMNIYTVGMATQGLANYLKKSFEVNDTIKVAIAHDSRNNSRLFAETTAAVLSANGIHVYLFNELRPTPMLSYAVREFKCQSGIVITASHNPKEYNGYKVYWNDGGQLVPPHDKNVIEEVRKVSIDGINYSKNDSLIEGVGFDFDKQYIAKVKSLSFQNYSANNGNDLSIVYTSIHGTGITVIPKVLEDFGFNNVHVLKSQAEPDGNFPTVIYPNPEEREALSLAIEKAKEIDADVIFGTDPDTDRVGMVVKHNNEYQILNGNQAGSLLVYYLLEQWKANNKLNGKQFVAKTIVTTDLIERIALGYNVDCYSTLTGFKYIADLIRIHEGSKEFIGGGEESYGYLVGDFVRDKDAVISTAILSEVAAWAKQQNKTLIDLLQDIYRQYGIFKEELISVTKKGISGAEEIQKIMDNFRADTPESIAEVKVLEYRDYQLGRIHNLANGVNTEITLPKSNVVQFLLEDGSLITARPSGTEPKIKFYLSVNDVLSEDDNFEEKDQTLKHRLDKLKQFLSH